MKAEFWLDKWKLNEIGFHQESTNESLQAHWPSVRAPAGGAVLVPLCGKSLDMCWLAEQGHAIIGIEVSALACTAFFAGLELKPRIEESGELLSMSAGPYRLLRGDFFASTVADIGAVDAFYDRAALVAMPPDMQPDYVRQLIGLLPPGTVGIVNCVEYPSDAMEGPPFSIDEARLRQLLSPYCRVERCASREVEVLGSGLKERGLARLTETVYRVRVNP
ncbi:MAG: thiopurine S-methyltransferase [Gammaproteobacteria bacterium]|nr:thiopurine S-methyltransferase [Gammaproteobacteria bacterium]MXW44500.1 thiopurine S-methyltransferase [Gammaproteobacteria bacterium]MYD01341.1 thiopurine S-methyltransferase [Gammaproteobacteria bacterium]MYI24661.1 thiopurine S-methyltransferase [Gammaproteobacteria bacterium]